MLPEVFESYIEGVLKQKTVLYDILVYNESSDLVIFDDIFVTLYCEKLLYEYSYIFILFLPLVNFVLFFSFHCLKFKNSYIFLLSPVLIFFSFLFVILNTKFEWLINPDFIVCVSFNPSVL